MGGTVHSFPGELALQPCLFFLFFSFLLDMAKTKKRAKIPLNNKLARVHRIFHRPLHLWYFSYLRHAFSCFVHFTMAETAFRATSTGRSKLPTCVHLDQKRTKASAQRVDSNLNCVLLVPVWTHFKFNLHPVCAHTDMERTRRMFAQCSPRPHMLAPNHRLRLY